jgi:UDP-N-acetylglucosamine 1-carboxyvinyltransferase
LDDHAISARRKRRLDIRATIWDNVSMDAFVIHGGKRLRGRVRVNGSKNATLPQIAAALLTDDPLTLRDVPDLSDIREMARLMTALGCPVVFEGDQPTRTLTATPTDASQCVAEYELVRRMRASICVLGPLVAKRGKARVSMPGGCAIGDRPVDLHIRGLKALGARIHLDEGYIVAEAPGAPGGLGGRLRGANVFLGGAFGSTVLGTANVMSAATLAEGTTTIECAACEPEIADLADLLNKMGAKITGAGSPRITIEGVEALRGTDHAVMPDRIEAGTYVLAAAITNGDVILENCPTDALWATIDRLHSIGVELEPTEDSPDDRMRQTVRVAAARRLHPVQITTQPHPGFPTDLQAQIMALLCMADGNSMITEKIFPDRFLHVAELSRMGADLVRNGPTVLISGVRELIGAQVMASDLRASAGLVLAGLAARGKTTISRVYHLDRGYERMELTLQQLGADIVRVNQDG